MTERGSTSAGRLAPSVGMSGWLAARLPIFYGWVTENEPARDPCRCGQSGCLGFINFDLSDSDALHCEDDSEPGHAFRQRFQEYADYLVSIDQEQVLDRIGVIHAFMEQVRHGRRRGKPNRIGQPLPQPLRAHALPDVPQNWTIKGQTLLQDWGRCRVTVCAAELLHQRLAAQFVSEQRRPRARQWQGNLRFQRLPHRSHAAGLIPP